MNDYYSFLQDRLNSSVDAAVCNWLHVSELRMNCAVETAYEQFRYAVEAGRAAGTILPALPPTDWESVEF